jgi:hypothetical protein
MLRILVINEVSPQIKNRTSIIFEKIVPILSKKNKIEIFWFSYNYKKNQKTTESWYELLHIHEFKNAKDVIEKVNPSLIYVMPGFNTIDYAFLLTARFFKIPTFGWVDGAPVFARMETNRKKQLAEYSRQFFERREHDGYNSEFRGVNYFKKNLFFIRTMRAIGNSYKQIISELVENFRLSLNWKFKEEQKNTRFNCDLLLVENEPTIDFACNFGLSKKNMRLMGDPTYDLAFEERSKKSFGKKNGKLNVLFITVNFTSGQGKTEWSVSKQNHMIKELVTEYEKIKDKISLKIKIHPISESYTAYKKILDTCKTDIQIFQYEDVFELIKEADVVLTSATSTAGLFALIMKKPIIIWNYFNVQGDLFIKEKIAINCDEASQIKDCLYNKKGFVQENELIINEFITKFCGMGNASQKIADAVNDLASKN